MDVHDLIGIGFGPSNIALAISLEELRHSGHDTDALFIEKQPYFAWHKDMLLADTDMQISFLKDLVTLRNPRSHFTFTNYLFEKGRLQDFINLKTFYPSRYEFNDYLEWAASQFDKQCAYQEQVIEVSPDKHVNEVSLLRVTSCDTTGKMRQRLTRNLVVSVGGTANIPECFQQVQADSRVFHSSQYLSSFKELDNVRQVAIIGAGQSAAEIFLDLHGHPNAPQVELIMRGQAIHPSDDSPSVNKIFNIEFTDYMYSRSPEERKRILSEFRHTNYAAPDIDQVEHIFKILYTQRVTGCAHHNLLTRHETQAVRTTDQSIELQLLDIDTQTVCKKHYDAVILATGYTRTQHKDLLEPLAPYFLNDELDRHYRLKTTANFKPTIFIQGGCETSHGISDTLLSIMAIRSHEIGKTLINTSQHSTKNCTKIVTG